ncbi:MAG TPA: hypothetical protein VEA69_13570 [Tepidisphaeraceae bacterium]|nr:hypothetical protein [Tepidisphaeraceae bacterium]
MRPAHVAPLALLLALASGACSSSVPTRDLDAPVGDRIVLFVPGVGGDNATCAGLKRAIVRSADTDVRVHAWGMSGPLFVMNFRDPAVHAKAETELAQRIETWSARNPRAQIDLIGHSAGCGVILGALKRLPTDTNTPGGHRITFAGPPSQGPRQWLRLFAIIVPHALLTPLGSSPPLTPASPPALAARVRNVVLLAPSVSPGYDLSPALRHVAGRAHAFHSDRDVWHLKWRCSTSGTYDDVKTPAAGHAGFAATHPRLTQHAYDPAWDALGHDGGHTGSVAEDFVRTIVLPLLDAR